MTTCCELHAQLTGIAINDNGVKADTSAMLDVNVNVTNPKRGFLLPRITTAERDAIYQPAKALLVYCTNVDSLEMNIGTAAAPHWIAFGPGSSLVGWYTTGNSGTNSGSNFIGTTDNVSLRFRTNNIERMLIDSFGRVGIGSSAFDATNPEKLLVDYGNTSSHTLATLRGSIDDYLQINIQNKSNGVNASTDYVATSDNGTDSTWYVDLGINSSTYSPGVANWGGPSDAYLYSYAKNLLIGTQQSYSDIIFMYGGGSTRVNTALRIMAPGGNIVVGTGEGTTAAMGNTIRGPNAGGTNIPGGSVTLQGGSGSAAGTGGSVNILAGTSPAGAYGEVNINANGNFASNINTGTSNSDVTIGGSSNNILFPKFNTVGSVFYSSAATGQIATTAVGTSGQFLMSNGAAAPSWSSGNGSFWQLTGNSGTVAGTNFLGTTDAVDVVTKTNNTERLRVTSAGNVGIGLSNPSYKLQVFAAANPLYLTGVQNGTVSTDSVLVITGGIVKKIQPLGTFASINKGTYSVTIPALSNNTGVSVTVTVTNAPFSATGPNPVVAINPEADLPAGLVIAWSRVSATNTVKIAFQNTSNSSMSARTLNFDISIIQ